MMAFYGRLYLKLKVKSTLGAENFQKIKTLAGFQNIYKMTNYTVYLKSNGKN